MISASNLAMRFGERTLFENVSFQFNPGNRYGLIGANGAGKTTLLKILSGMESATLGEVSWPRDSVIGFLKQDQFLYEEERVMDVVIRGNPQLHAALRERDSIYEKADLTDADGTRLAILEEIIEKEDGYSAEATAGRLLSGLGISTKQQEGKMKELSGGYKLRVLLARVLFQNPDIMLLDEPTNHLDIVSIRWLEDFLATSYRGLLVLISHDREFLNRVCTHIADVDYETVTLYTGNYEDFVESKSLAMEQRIKEAEGAEKKRAELQDFINRFGAKASKARQAQSRQKQLDKIELPDIKKTSRIYPSIRFGFETSTGREVLAVSGLLKSYGARTLFQNLTFEIERGERVAIVGPNGVGKSTLLKIIQDELKPDSGTYKWGHEVRISYFAQDHHEALSGPETVYEWLYAYKPEASIGTIRGTLGALLFSGDDVHKKIEALSGGESARLLLAKMVLARGNVLILDEPTNHLDLESVASLEEALATFDGTVIFVSHDKHFVSTVATRILAITEEGLRDFSGSYVEYLDKLGDDYLARANPNLRKKEDAAEVVVPGVAVKEEPVKAVPALSYEERKALKNKVSKLKKDSAEAEKNIAQLEERIFAIEGQLATSSGDIAALASQRETLQAELALTMEKWEKIHAEHERLAPLLG